MKSTRLREYPHSVCLLIFVGLFCALAVLCSRAQPAPDVIWSQKTQGRFCGAVAVSPTGQYVASPGTNHSIRLAHVADGSAVRNLVGHTGPVASVAFSPSGRLLASTSDDRTWRLWSIDTGKLLRTTGLGNRSAGAVQFTSVAFHPDGHHVATDRHRTNVVLWNTLDGTSVWETNGNTAGIQSIAISPDGAWVAAAGGIRKLDVHLRVIRASDGALIRSILTTNSYGLRQLAFSPDGRWLAVGCYETRSAPDTVEIWRVADWTRYRQLPVTAPALAFSPDSKWLVTLRNRSLDVWSVPGAH